MLNSVSWSSFLFYLVGAAIVYYLVIGCIFYRQALLKLIGVSGHATFAGNHSHPKHDEHSFHHIAVHDLLEDLKILYATAKQKSYHRPELLQGIAVVFNKYRSLKNTPLQDAINHQVLIEADQHCNTKLSIEDVAGAWH